MRRLILIVILLFIFIGCATIAREDQNISMPERLQLPAPSIQGPTGIDKVAIIVEEKIYPALQEEISQYVLDVQERFPVELKIYSGNWQKAEPLREFLKELYLKENISGAVLIGLLPTPMWEFTREKDDNEKCPIPTVFYSDFDAQFFDNDKDGYYDQRIWGQNEPPEIWLALIRPPLQNPVGALRKFFQKTHQYYLGSLVFPKSALLFVAQLWQPTDFSRLKAAIQAIYGENLLVKNSGPLSGKEYLEELEKGQEFVYVWSHAGSQAHQFDTEPLRIVSGQIIRNLKKGGALLTIIWGCHTADFIETPNDNLVLGYVFGSGLAAIGCTRSLGIGEVEKILSNLAKGEYLGKAYFLWQNKIYNYQEIYGKYPKEIEKWVFDYVLIGNPFLYLMPVQFSTGQAFFNPET